MSKQQSSAQLKGRITLGIFGSTEFALIPELLRILRRSAAQHPRRAGTLPRARKKCHAEAEPVNPLQESYPRANRVAHLVNLA